MKCPSCQTYVIKIPINWKCPHCGKRLPEPTRWYIFYQNLIEYVQERGALFWSIWFGILLLIVGAVEAIGGRTFLLSYIGNNILVSIVAILFTGMLLDMVMKINLPLRLQSGPDFIIRERAVIRGVRKGTNLAALAGMAACLIWLKPRTFLEYFPAYPVVVSWFLAMSWAVTGLFLDVKMVEDVRFRAYMERLGITSLKRYRRVGTLIIGIMILVAITYNVLVRIPELWIKFSNLAIIGVLLRFSKQYLGWLF